MSKENLKKVHLIYGIVLSVLLAIVAVLFIVMCIDIYRSGDDPFTRESIGAHFAKISAFVYILIALIIGGAVLNIVAPAERKKLKGTVNNRLVLDKLTSKLKGVSSEASAKIEKQHILRFIMIVVSAVLVVGASTSALIYVFVFFETPGKNINSEVAFGWLCVLRYFIAPFIYLTVTAYVCKYSIKKELEIVKGEIKNSGDVSENCENAGTFTKLTRELNETAKRACEPKTWHKPLSLTIKCTIACLAVVFIIVGIANGGMDDVVNKAVAICRECIGMG